MEKEPTYEELLAEIAILRDQNKRKDELIAYLQRLLYGTKSDRLASKVPENQPGLFDELFQEAMDEKARQIEQAAKDNEVVALGAWRLCDVLQAARTRTLPSAHFLASGHRVQVNALGRAGTSDGGNFSESCP